MMRVCVGVLIGVSFLLCEIGAPLPALADSPAVYSVLQKSISKDHVVIDQPGGSIDIVIIGINGFKYKNARAITVRQTLSPPDLSQVLTNVGTGLPVGLRISEKNRPDVTKAIGDLAKCGKPDKRSGPECITKFKTAYDDLSSSFSDFSFAVKIVVTKLGLASNEIDDEITAELSTGPNLDAYRKKVEDQYPKISALAVPVLLDCDHAGEYFSFDCVEKYENLLAEFNRSQAASLTDYIKTQNPLPFSRNGTDGAKLSAAYELATSTIKDLVGTPRTPATSEPPPGYLKKFVLTQTEPCARGLGFNGFSDAISVVAEPRAPDGKVLAADIVTVDCPSRLLVSAGVGYSTLPLVSYQGIQTLSADGTKVVGTTLGFQTNSKASTNLAFPA